MKFFYYEKREFETLVRKGIANYLEQFENKDYELKTVTLSIKKVSDNELMWFVPQFFDKVVHYYKFPSYIDVAGVIVGKKHGHFIARMPYINYPSMRDYWKEITGGDTGFYIRRLGKRDLKRVVKGREFSGNPLVYCLSQEKRDEYLEYVATSTWGLVNYYSKKAKNSFITQKL